MGLYIHGLKTKPTWMDGYNGFVYEASSAYLGPPPGHIVQGHTPSEPGSTQLRGCTRLHRSVCA